MDFEEEVYNLDSDDDMAEDGSDMAEYDNLLDEPDSAAASGQKQYKILQEEDIKLLLENDISTVCEVLSVPRGVACSLLCTNNWSFTSAYEHWLAADADDDGGERRNPDSAVICKICYDETLPEKMASAACGHLFCAECWRTYIATALSDGGAACHTLCCPEPPCKAAVTVDMVEGLSSEAEINDYNKHLLRSYVESNRKRKWCPAAGCGRAVELDSEDYQVVCDCSHKFCWNCLEENHRPASCKTVAEWMEKNSSEAENTQWILAYTKPCPKCKRPIEKNHGCNHMTCGSPCRHEFCWLCGAWWKGHGSCKKFKFDDSGRKGAKRRLERYVYYYERWHSCDKSMKMAMSNLDKARGKLEGEWRWGFVVEAWEQVVEALRVLKWSYASGYYLPEEHGKTMFECLQKEAKAALDRLHHLVEKEMVDDEFDDSQVLNEFKVKLVRYTSSARNFFKTFLYALENDFAHG